jgi:hypothetical protein
MSPADFVNRCALCPVLDMGGADAHFHRLRRDANALIGFPKEDLTTKGTKDTKAAQEAGDDRACDQVPIFLVPLVSWWSVFLGGVAA